MADVGNIIRELRDELGISQREAAERIWGDRNLQSVLSEIENGKRSPTWETLERIADALDCDLDVRFVPREKPATGFKRPKAGDD